MNTKHLLAATGLVLAVGAAIYFWPSGHGPGPTALPPPEKPAVPTIRVDRDRGATVDVVGLGPAQLATLAALLPERWPSVFWLRVASADGTTPPDRPAIPGSYVVKDGVLRFLPHFPLERGVHYLAVFDPAGVAGLAGTKVLREVLLLPKRPRAQPTSVAHVYPTADRLPENQLKFYLHFTAPMSRGQVYDYIHLLGPGGKEVDLPFLELVEELWDRDGKRLTLLFDPGRIKRGLKPREEVGPALEEGKSYTLVIDRDWPDAEGEPLRQTYRKTFTAGPPDDVCPDPKTWQVKAPPAGTREKLVVTSPEPLDHALFQRLLQVTDAEGRPVAGQAEVMPGETTWEFTPREPWHAGTFRLVIDTWLEDLAGNHIGRPFEVDVFRTVQREVKSETVSLPFTVAPR
jgi:hypothetical protein